MIFKPLTISFLIKDILGYGKAILDTLFSALKESKFHQCGFSLFTSLGYLIGNLVGLTAASVTGTLIGLLFAFSGGSAIAFMHKIDANARIQASKAILALTLACLVGVYTRIYVSDNQLLTRDAKKVGKRISIEANKYNRNKFLSKANAVDQRRANNHLSWKEAYEELYEFMTSYDESKQ